MQRSRQGRRTEEGPSGAVDRSAGRCSARRTGKTRAAGLLSSTAYNGPTEQAAPWSCVAPVRGRRGEKRRRRASRRASKPCRRAAQSVPRDRNEECKHAAMRARAISRVCRGDVGGDREQEGGAGQGREDGPNEIALCSAPSIPNAGHLLRLVALPYPLSQPPGRPLPQPARPAAQLHRLAAARLPPVVPEGA